MINIQWLNLGPLNEARFGKRDDKKSADDVLYFFYVYRTRIPSQRVGNGKGIENGFEKGREICDVQKVH